MTLSFEARRRENIQQNGALLAPLQITAAKISSSSSESGFQSSSRRKRSFNVYRSPNPPRRARYGGSYADAGNCASDNDPDKGNNVDSGNDPDEGYGVVDYDDSERSKNDKLARAAAARKKHVAESSSQPKTPRR